MDLGSSSVDESRSYKEDSDEDNIHGGDETNTIGVIEKDVDVEDIEARMTEVTAVEDEDTSFPKPEPYLLYTKVYSQFALTTGPQEISILRGYSQRHGVGYSICHQFHGIQGLSF